MRREGSCLCGACRFSAASVSDEAGVCHCSMCRKWTGGINIAVGCTDVVWNSAAPLSRFRSSDRAERVFCGTCGSNLYWRALDDGPAEQVIALNAFNDPDAFAVTRQIYVDEKPDCYAMGNETPMLTGAEARALHAEDAAENA